MSSGNGGGKGFFKTLTPESLSGGGNFFENLFADIVNVGTQVGTGGLAGYGDGKFGPGIVGTEVVSGIKEVTGAKAAEQANKLAREQFEQTKVDAEAARVQAQQNTATSQMQKSNIAGAARSARVSSKNSGQPVGSYSLGSDEKDFLGL